MEEIAAQQVNRLLGWEIGAVEMVDTTALTVGC